MSTDTPSTNDVLAKYGNQKANASGQSANAAKDLLPESGIYACTIDPQSVELGLTKIKNNNPNNRAPLFKFVAIIKDDEVNAGRRIRMWATAAAEYMSAGGQERCDEGMARIAQNLGLDPNSASLKDIYAGLKAGTGTMYISFTNASQAGFPDRYDEREVVDQEVYSLYRANPGQISLKTPRSTKPGSSMTAASTATSASTGDLPF
jgi:hypothetical protein